MSSIHDVPPGSSTASYGKILPLQTHYGANQPYWAYAGAAGSAGSTINTQNVTASTIVLAGNGTIGDGFPALVLNGQPIVFSGSGDYDNSSMAILQNNNTVIPYGESNIDPNVIQIFCEGTGSENVPGKILTGGVYFNPQQSFIGPSTICSQITGDASGNVDVIGLSFNTQNINTSTIVVNSTSEYGLSIFSAPGTAANAQLAGDASASISLSSGGVTSLSLQGDSGYIYLATGSGGVIERNNIQLEQRDTVAGGKNAGVYIVGHNDFAAITELEHREEIGDEVYTTVKGSVRVGGEQYVSTMNIGLYDASGNPLAELGFRDSGLATNVVSAQSFTAVNTGVGLGSVFYPGFNNANSPLDILQAIPLARVLNSTGGDATSTSGINQFGRMTPGTIAQVIPTTTWSDASKVVLAPRTFIQLYTGSGGSGASVVYSNTDNSLFATFTADPNMNTLAFNSYRFGFGN
jgi:hypothetical protein